MKMGLWGKLKGILYVGSIAAPGLIAFNQLGGTKNAQKAASGTIMAYAFMNPNGQFSWQSGVQMWAPVAVLCVADTITGPKVLNIQKRISNGIKGLTSG